MSETVRDSDMGVGMTVLFGLVALLGAVVMYVGAADQLLAGAGFAAAMLAAMLAVAALHVYS